MTQNVNVLKTFKNGTTIFYDRGKFDDYCVYLCENNQRYAPRDIEYFQYFKDLLADYSKEKIYSDFCEIYYLTTGDVDNKIFGLIENISKTYFLPHQQDVEIWFTVMYLGMVAEEKKAFAKLKKKIKRLGFHQIIFENFTALQAANFSRGKKATELFEECKKRGF